MNLTVTPIARLDVSRRNASIDMDRGEENMKEPAALASSAGPRTASLTPRAAKVSQSQFFTTPLRYTRGWASDLRWQQCTQAKQAMHADHGQHAAGHES
jgi:hypothetical protein